MKRNIKQQKKQNEILLREFRAALQLRVVREVRVEYGDEKEYVYVMMGDTRYKVAMDGAQLFFSALGQPSFSCPLPEEYPL